MQMLPMMFLGEPSSFSWRDIFGNTSSYVALSFGELVARHFSVKLVLNS